MVWPFRTYKNLEKRVILECDGEAIPLPSLQGIVVLNIQSFMGGTNFWGNAKDDNVFLPPGFDDGILEVTSSASFQVAILCFYPFKIVLCVYPTVHFECIFEHFA